MAELGQQTVDFSTLVGRAAEESYTSLKELVDNSKSAEQSDTEKKINLLKFLVKTQQRMLRLNVLAKWCQQVPLIQYSQQLTSTLSNHDMCFTQTADSLFFMHEGLQQARAPIYDVPSAIEILLTGTYQRLPKCVEDVGVLTTLNEEEQKPVLKKLDMLVRSKLLEVTLPKEISQVDISDGTVLLRVDGEFKVLVTLGYRGHMSLWRILHLELLVGERSGPVKLEETRKHILGDDLERRMAASDNPFLSLYSVLHELCVALVMNTVIRQVQILRKGRWRDAIKFELISDGGMGQVATTGSSQIQDVETDSPGLRTPGLKILYWLDFDNISGTTDSSSCPYIKIEPGSDMLIKCLHSTFVIDPITGKEAEFSLDQSYIDVEKLLLSAICYNRYTRLLEVYKELVKCSASGDVILQIHADESAADYKKGDGKSIVRGTEGQEVLRVRAYGSSFFSLGINTRKGRFLLHSSRDILTASTILECEDALNQGSMTATQVFSSLRSKSILHLFACTSRFIGLEVYENNLSAVKLPKNILNGPNVLLMGFPDCGSSYFLLMQLDNDLKLIFKLLEARSDPSGKVQSLAELNNVNRVKIIDVANIPMLEDELNLSLLDSGKLNLLSPSDMDTNENPEHALLSKLSFNDSMLGLGSQTSSFSSVVDDVFELEKGSSVQSVHLSFNKSSHFGMNFQNQMAGTSSPKWEGGPQVPQMNSVPMVSSVSPHYGGPIYSFSNSKGMLQYDSVGSPSNMGRNSNSKKLSASKSDQDLASLLSPPSADSHSVIDEDRLSAGNLSSRILSPPKPTGPRLSATMTRPSDPKNLITEALSGPAKLPWPNSWAETSSYSGAGPYSGTGTVPRHDKWSGKRTISDMLGRIPTLQCLETSTGLHKRRKTSESTHTQGTSAQALVSSDLASVTAGYNYASLVAEANKGHAPSTVYVSALLHVVRHCSLCIKHARLTSQMKALDIPFVEDVGLRIASSHIWFRLPFAKGYTWKTVCLRLGQPGSMYWDVKINDQHFKDLWELQKGSVSTPWGSGVRIANASDADSHIRYDSEGVVLSYQSVEANSIKKLVADIQRLYSARTFAHGMRNLLGVRSDEKMEDFTANSDGKSVANAKGPPETIDKLSEQMRRAFSIEAVGLMSLWFSFGSGVLARFVVEWESGKDGCTMHVSPDQLWPHTKFLEDFINGAEVASLLDCIRLTAGPLHALAAATRPARAGPTPGVSGAATSVPPSAKQSVFLQPQGHTQSNVTANATQGLSGSGGNPGSSTPSGPSGNHGLHGASGRGGPGIVPSSLLPIDVSVVLRGPYWIRIIYREYFAVDMRCFAGDQVWLQPATPPKEGPSVGGSLPCPQFRPFIMEHVAQELNGLEPNFTGGQQNLGMSNINSPSNGTSPQLSNSAGNRVNLPRVGAQVINRVGNSLPTSSNTSMGNSGLPLRRAPAAGVPAHVRGELNTAIIGLGDDGGYGGGWVPIVALKKVLRGILKYLGVLWLFAQLPDLLREILGSILKDSEGTLLNLDHEQPALRFFVGGYVFAVSVHRVQLLLQVLSVKRFHQSQQQNPATSQEELTQSEISEICEFFSRRVASEPYDASRVASFVTLLTLPISVLREFLKLISWKKGLAQAQGGDTAPSQKPRIELCLENHAGFNPDGSSDNSSVTKSNIHYDRPRNSVDFGLTVVLDPAHIPHINAAGGAAWLPYCVSVRLRYSFGDNPSVSFIGMEGSHGGRACWLRIDDWEKSKQRVARTIEVNGSAGDVTQGRLRIIADSVQRTLHICLQGLRDGSGGVVTASAAGPISH
ncbi:mediator of RNA polymerase II transcription subunit 14 [Impatiens glandulifera]|uniref:mediator of RNA polymerase II transcription subunit 14 n=1 Tax=Impatiens glandulifera TaxID=253017 RepID=UPI001FB125CB|nr:mediator of RNA polymerase II transcription subunit 14 [Impatiens glandulifera]